MIDFLHARKRRRITVGSALAVGCLAAALATPAAADADPAEPVVQTLHGVVGPDHEIHIDQRSVPAGQYEIVVRDRSDDHNFHMKNLDDPSSFDMKTRVEQVRKVVWNVDLAPGRYRIHCDPHRDEMKTFMTVT